MAGELQLAYTESGSTVYAIIRNSTGSVWQTTSSTFVTYVTANIANYVILLTEQGTASRYYAGNFPAAARGTYQVVIYKRLTGSYLETDTLLGTGSIEWDGSSVISLAAVYISAGSGTGQLDFTSGVVKANATQWLGGTIPAVNVTGVPLVDMTHILGTAVSTPATAGILDVNVKRINNVTASTPGASGGLLISGSNTGTTTLAALTVTGTFTISDGLSIARSTSNASAIVATGNGTGSGAIITSGSGATGDGVKMVAASTNGSGLTLTGTGSGYDFNLTTPDTNLPGLSTPPTAAEIATAVWTDTTGSDFTTVSSIGKALYPDGSGYPSVNVISINSSTNAADNQQAALDVMYRGTITGGATTTTLISSDLSQALTDLWKGRVLLFTSGNLIYRATAITAFNPATDELTFSAIGGTPINGDAFVII